MLNRIEKKYKASLNAPSFCNKFEVIFFYAFLGLNSFISQLKLKDILNIEKIFKILQKFKLTKLYLSLFTAFIWSLKTDGIWFNTPDFGCVFTNGTIG